MPGYRIALIPGDGIGKEVLPEGRRVLEVAAATVLAAIEQVLGEPELRTPDLGGAAGTEACGRAVAEAVSRR